MSKIRLPQHHFSIGDWQSLKYPTTGYNVNQWQLDITDFISAPSAVIRKLRHPTLPFYCTQALKTSVIGNVYEGQIESYVKLVTPLAGGSMGFVIHQHGNEESEATQIPLDTGINLWKLFRLTFWHSYDFQNVEKTQCHLERYVVDHWETVSTTFVPRRESGTSRVGFWSKATANLYIWTVYDNTFVYW